MHFLCLIKRLFVFSFIIYIILQRTIKDSDDDNLFMDRVHTNIKKMNIKNEILINFISSQNFLTNCYYANIVILFMIWLAIVFNSQIGKIIGTFYFGLLVYIYYSPILPESKIHSDNLYGLSKDFLLYVAIFLGMVTYCFKECDTCNGTKITDINEDKVNKQEIEMTNIKKDKNSKKPKKSKKIKKE